MDFSKYILPELLLLIPVLWVIGYVIKKSKVADEKIPLILFACGIMLAGLWIICQTSLTTSQQWGMAIFSAITQGILCAGTAIGADQVLKQATKTTSTDEQLIAQAAAPLMAIPADTIKNVQEAIQVAIKNADPPDTNTATDNTVTPVVATPVDTPVPDSTEIK